MIRYKDLVNRFCYNFKKEKDQFTSYLEQNYYLAIFDWIFFMILYSAWIIQTYTHLEGAFLVNEEGSMFNWETFGRWAMILNKHLTNTAWFNPVFEKIAGYSLFIASGVYFSYCIAKRLGEYRKNLKFILGILPLIIFTSPVFFDQLFYDLQTLSIACGFIFIVIGVNSILNYENNNDVISLVLGIILCVFSFGTYQAFVFLYITLIICFVLFDSIFTEKSISWKRIGNHIIIFIVIYGINTLISRLTCLSNSAYFTNQIKWLDTNIISSIKYLIAVMKNLLLDESAYYSSIYAFIMAAAVIICGLYLIGSKIKKYILVLLCLLAFEISAFSLNIISANIMGPRTMFSYMFVNAGNIILPLAVLAKINTETSDKVRKINFNFFAKNCVYILMVICLVVNIQKVSRLMYTSSVIDREQREMAQDINIKTLDSREKPLVFVGTSQVVTNNACYSLSDINGANEGALWLGYFNLGNEWIYSYLKSEGIDRPYPSDEQIERASELAAEMSTYPEDGSIKEFDDIIVVKIG